MLQDECLPSDHAPICVSLQAPNLYKEQVKSRALLSGSYAVLMTKENNLSKAPVRSVLIPFSHHDYFQRP